MSVTFLFYLCRCFCVFLRQSLFSAAIEVAGSERDHEDFKGAVEFPAGCCRIFLVKFMCLRFASAVVYFREPVVVVLCDAIVEVSKDNLKASPCLLIQGLVFVSFASELSRYHVLQKCKEHSY